MTCASQLVISVMTDAASVDGRPAEMIRVMPVLGTVASVLGVTSPPLDTHCSDRASCRISGVADFELSIGLDRYRVFAGVPPRGASAMSGLTFWD
jgi:hypothetical protein